MELSLEQFDQPVVLEYNHWGTSMAYQFWVSIEGVKTGFFKGGTAPIQGKEGEEASKSKKAVVRTANPSRIVGYEFLYALTAPRDQVTGQPTGKRRHEPITFVKRWDAASPQLFNAAATNENLKSVLFEFVRSSSKTGQEEIFYTIKLTNAKIAEFRQYIGDVKNSQYDSTAASLELENISFVFQKIEMAHIDGTMAQDDFLQSP
jgi:type VI secretion system secreted protein Hcp